MPARKAVIGIYGMGLTQHRKGVAERADAVNLLLLRGNIGKPGAGICPVRGHSNVQGQRTVGITEKPELVPLDKLAELYGFEPPREKGLNTVEACEGVLDGAVRAFVGLGGNFVRAVPETGADGGGLARAAADGADRHQAQPQPPRARRGRLPAALPRPHRDRPAGERRAGRVDRGLAPAASTRSRGMAEPASATPAVRAGHRRRHRQGDAGAEPEACHWDAWVGDYAPVRDAIEATYPDDLPRLQRAHVAARRLPPPDRRARSASWKTPDRQGQLHRARTRWSTDPDTPAAGADVLRLITLRSDDQFNTTIYGYDDRFRGVYGTRLVLLMNAGDIARLGLAEGDRGHRRARRSTTACAREVAGLRVTPYDIPQGCVAGYFPECNPLIPLWHHAEESKVPAAKSISITLSRTEAA